MRPLQPGSPTLSLRVLYPLAVLCAVGLAVLIYFVVNGPLTQWRRSLTQRAEQRRASLTQGPELRKRHRDGQNQLAELMQRVELVNSRVPDDANEAEFLADLSRLANAGGVQIDNFRLVNTIKKETHSIALVSVHARGSYPGLCRLIDGVSRLPRLVELSNMEVEAEPGQSSRPAKFDFSLYYGMSTPSVEATTL